jgi:hypothetical protein
LALGTQHRYGGFDWPLEEVLNTIVANQKNIPSPKIHGYGFIFNKFGFVEEIFLVFDFLDGYITGPHYAQSVGIRPLVLRIMDLTCVMLKKGIVHMDFSGWNIMIPKNKDLLNAKVIDFEKCYIGNTDYIPEILGRHFGRIYRINANHENFFDEADYDELVKKMVSDYGGVDYERFLRVYMIAKRRHSGRQDAGRKETKMLATKGIYLPVELS